MCRNTCKARRDRNKWGKKVNAYVKGESITKVWMEEI